MSSNISYQVVNTALADKNHPITYNMQPIPESIMIKCIIRRKKPNTFHLWVGKTPREKTQQLFQWYGCCSVDKWSQTAAWSETSWAEDSFPLVLWNNSKSWGLLRDHTQPVKKYPTLCQFTPHQTAKTQLSNLTPKILQDGKDCSANSQKNCGTARHSR